MENKRFLTVPNILSVARIIMVPFFIMFYILGYTKISFILFVISGITDVLDGFIARKFNQISDIGKVLDPLADKVTILSVLACLYSNGFINIFIFIFIAAKEIFQIIGGTFLWKKKIVVSSNFWGKMTTVLLYAGIISIFIWPKQIIGNILLFIAILFAGIAVVQYTIKNKKIYNEKKKENAWKNNYY